MTLVLCVPNSKWQLGVQRHEYNLDIICYSMDHPDLYWKRNCELA